MLTDRSTYFYLFEFHNNIFFHFVHFFFDVGQRHKLKSGQQQHTIAFDDITKNRFDVVVDALAHNNVYLIINILKNDRNHTCKIAYEVRDWNRMFVFAAAVFSLLSAIYEWSILNQAEQPKIMYWPDKGSWPNREFRSQRLLWNPENYYSIWKLANSFSLKVVFVRRERCSHVTCWQQDELSQHMNFIMIYSGWVVHLRRAIYMFSNQREKKTDSWAIIKANKSRCVVETILIDQKEKTQHSSPNKKAKKKTIQFQANENCDPSFNHTRHGSEWKSFDTFTTCTTKFTHAHTHLSTLKSANQSAHTSFPFYYDLTSYN